jgi:hypothetical protein
MVHLKIMQGAASMAHTYYMAHDQFSRMRNGGSKLVELHYSRIACLRRLVEAARGCRRIDRLS